MLAGILLISLPAVAWIIEKSTSKSDRRFKLGYRPFSMSWKGWILTILWVALWIFMAKSLIS